MIKVAFVGAGARALSHMASIATMPDAEVVAISDISEEIGRAAQDKANGRLADGVAPIDARFFTDLRQMADAVDFDALYLCLPPFVHGEIDHQAIDLGKALFIEKPLSVEMSVANEIASHIKESGIVNAVGHQMRYSRLMDMSKELLNGVPIGMAIAIRLSNLPGQPWWRVQNKSGGMLIEQHVHAVDMMRVLCGEIESAYAVGGTLLSDDVEGIDIFDVNACTVKLANGAPGIIGNSTAAPQARDLYPGHQVNVVAKDLVLSVQTHKTTVRRPDAEPEEFTSSDDITYLINESFIDAVRAGNQGTIRCDYADALKSFAVTVACQQSAETGKVVEIADLLKPTA